MKTESRGISQNCSIAVPVWPSIKRAVLTLHEKGNNENKWLNIRARNKSKSVER